MDTNPTYNYFGATVFWLYNVAALSFTAIVLVTIAQLPARRYPGRQSPARVFITLAGISFTVLSVNMLHVLIQSYYEWSQTIFGRLAVERNGMLRSIWTWSITSTLFRDFGEAIVADQARYVWTLSALIATMSVSTYMATEGRRQQVPRLWAFFALAQILPISFTQNLFYVALTRQGPATTQVDVRPTSFAVAFALYALGLSVAPGLAGTPWLIPLIVAARLLLFVQLALVKTRIGTARSELSQLVQRPIAFVGGILLTRQVYLASRSHTMTEIAKAVISHPAVSSLGFDFVLSALSLSIWIALTTREGEDETDADKKKNR
ncbi:hypothetical protein BAUCODRAFT_152568 [Baudoinia panamericana UAMH 10762]|uniref:Uncharacterized protein n=1 Tax=Baudoinia panamericana (strain UAMH 10762) TaxID=717646 RepID=M2MXB3_BAUPA|nr:uncharacterized protein BAUCODRAFT_152568 [Baudoinia panamericana UAMH 10762]EMC91294.1 hypothetical protein BAUCODRAFT_152568 [Baudoinia panamericana UAMH 10762]